MRNELAATSGFEISNWMHLSVGQVDCNHLSECTIHLSEIYKANATYVKIRNTQSSVGQVLQVFHSSACHFYSSQTIGRVKFRTLHLGPVSISDKTYYREVSKARDRVWKCSYLVLGRPSESSTKCLIMTTLRALELLAQSSSIFQNYVTRLGAIEFHCLHITHILLSICIGRIALFASLIHFRKFHCTAGVVTTLPLEQTSLTWDCH